MPRTAPGSKVCSEVEHPWPLDGKNYFATRLLGMTKIPTFKVSILSFSFHFFRPSPRALAGGSGKRSGIAPAPCPYSGQASDWGGVRTRLVTAAGSRRRKRRRKRECFEHALGSAVAVRREGTQVWSGRASREVLQEGGLIEILRRGDSA
jgi:hypothetical protein